jgi:hypothetical protein
MDRKEMMEKADELGLEYKKNISNDALSELIEGAEGTTEVETEEEVDTEAAIKEVADRLAKEQKAMVDAVAAQKVEEKKPAKATIGNAKAQARKEAMKLVRCIVTPMDKDKAELNGEIISCGNSMTGMIKKYIPFGKEWHIPTVIVDTLKDKKMLSTRDRKTPKGTIKENIELPQYNVQILPDLTQEELNRLVKENK